MYQSLSILFCGMEIISTSKMLSGLETKCTITKGEIAYWDNCTKFSLNEYWLVYIMHITLNISSKHFFFSYTFERNGHHIYCSFGDILPATFYLKRGSYVTRSFWTRVKINMSRSISVTGPLCVLCPPPIFAHVEITSQLDAYYAVYVNKLLFHDPFILWTRERP